MAGFRFRFISSKEMKTGAVQIFDSRLMGGYRLVHSALHY
jgi:hypothetical protein